jgi:nucleolar protein 16
VAKTFTPTEARVERDESGKIIRVIHDERRKANPLNDALNDIEDDEAMDGEMDGEDEGFEGFEDEDEGGRAKNQIIRQLELQAASGVEKRERKQSEREQEWLERLVVKHGEQYGKMARDRKLNPMQQTEADIKRRVAKWKANGGNAAIEA